MRNNNDIRNSGMNAIAPPHYQRSDLQQIIH